MTDESMEATAEYSEQDIYSLLDIVEFLQEERDLILERHNKLYNTHRRKVREAELRIKDELVEILDTQDKIIRDLRLELSSKT